MAINHLVMGEDYSGEDYTPALVGRTDGCDCCSDTIAIPTRKEALAKLQDWEDEILYDLRTVQQLRVLVLELPEERS
jgi:hypothetical protein